MGKRTLSKKEIEELKKKEQEEAAAHVNKTLTTHKLLDAIINIHF